MKNKIYISKPYLPPLDEYIKYLESIWNSKQLTNNGPFHKEFEEELCDYLGVKYISLFSNATIALLIAIRVLELKGEIITTPYSFVATSHAVKWNNIDPVFIDVEPNTCNLNPYLIERAITDKTSAILPVHVYGNPCNVEKIGRIAERNNLKIIYDAAHAFGTQIGEDSILKFGDLSVLSFHATKLFNTFEGGAIVSHSSEMKRKIDDLKNFGFQDQTTVEGIGINGKMNEVQAALGILQLKYIDQIIEKRKIITEIYRAGLKKVNGIFFLDFMNNVRYNYAYFPIFIKESEYGISRDEVFEKLAYNNIYARRYFYPLISQFSSYKDMPSSKLDNLTVANNISNDVICLPIYPDLDTADVERIIEILKTL